MELSVCEISGMHKWDEMMERMTINFEISEKIHEKTGMQFAFEWKKFKMWNKIIKEEKKTRKWFEKKIINKEKKTRKKEKKVQKETKCYKKFEKLEIMAEKMV